ncbi:MAG: FixH family protein [Aestuariivirga sp.]
MTREFTGRHMAMIMVLFFATVLAANLAMVFAARQSWTGLVVKNSYVASQKFDEVTARLEESANMDVHPAISYRGGEVRILLRDASGVSVAVHSAELKIGRPSHDSEDRLLTMTCSSPGDCVAPIALGTGMWTGEISASLALHRTWVRPIRLWVEER